LPEQVVADYQTIRLSLKGHPLAIPAADADRAGGGDVPGDLPRQ
jgi:hypothetical protein